MSSSPVHLVGTGTHDTATPDVHTASAPYAQRFAGPTGEWMLERQASGVRDLLEHIAVSSSTTRLRVLDMGGGHGQLTRLLLDAGHEVVVQGSHESCFQLLRPEHPDLDSCVASSLWRLPFAAGTFDLVIGVRLLAHVRAWKALLAEMSRVSRRWVVVEFARTHGLLDIGPLGRTIFRLKQRLERTPRPFYTYSEKAVSSALEECGLQVTRVHAQFMVPMFMHRTLRSPSISSGLESSLARLGAGTKLRSPVLLLAERGAVVAPKSGAASPAAVYGSAAAQSESAVPALG